MLPEILVPETSRYSSSGKGDSVQSPGLGVPHSGGNVPASSPDFTATHNHHLTGMLHWAKIVLPAPECRPPAAAAAAAVGTQADFIYPVPCKQHVAPGCRSSDFPAFVPHNNSLHAHHITVYPKLLMSYVCAIQEGKGSWMLLAICK